MRESAENLSVGQNMRSLSSFGGSDLDISGLVAGLAIGVPCKIHCELCYTNQIFLGRITHDCGELRVNFRSTAVGPLEGIVNLKRGSYYCNLGIAPF
jgi:hypothetical protein